jgi:hypothetical protein
MAKSPRRAVPVKAEQLRVKRARLLFKSDPNDGSDCVIKPSITQIGRANQPNLKNPSGQIFAKGCGGAGRNRRGRFKPERRCWMGRWDRSAAFRPLQYSPRRWFANA